MRWAVEAKKRRRDEEQGQSMGQKEDKKAESTDELKMMSRSEEVRTGRGSACLVQRTDEKCLTNEICRKGKGKGNGGKGEHERKGGEGNKGAMHVENSVMDEDQENMRATMSEENHEEDVRKLLEMVEKEEMELEMLQQEELEHEELRRRVAPNMEAGGSHPQATSDPRKKKKATRVLRWADCNDEEGKENEEEVEEEKEAGQRGTTEERPPGLEEVESKQEEKKEQEAERKQKQEQEGRAKRVVCNVACDQLLGLRTMFVWIPTMVSRGHTERTANDTLWCSSWKTFGTTGGPCVCLWVLASHLVPRNLGQRQLKRITMMTVDRGTFIKKTIRFQFQTTSSEWISALGECGLLRSTRLSTQRTVVRPRG